ncbi:MAG: CvpA family protein [Pseudomonadota bacterium]
MNDAIATPLTAFDALAVTVIILSALMALARGFMRELATLGAFIAAIAAAYYARLLLRDPLAGLLGGDAPSWTTDAVLVLGAFGIVYIVVAWIGGRLSRNIQGLEGIGLVDRVAGLVFGVARGVVAMVFAVLLITQALSLEDLPSWIAESRLYPYFHDWADALRDAAPRIAEQSEEAQSGAEPDL